MPGSAGVLLHRVFCEVNSRKGAWDHAIGGMNTITQAVAKAGQTHGVEIRLNDGVREVLMEKGRATGVVTTKRKRFAVRVEVSNLKREGCAGGSNGSSGRHDGDHAVSGQGGAGR